ncbi:MAG: DsbC family protein [Aquificae bacterium]|nr:DsbC family protein [Aquificota bacterium]
MKKAVLSFTALCTLSFSALAKCLPPNQITPKAVEQALSKVAREPKVDSVSPTPIQGLYEVVIETPRGKAVYYIDCSLNYLVSGEIIDINQRKSLTRERMAQLQQEKAKKMLAELEKRMGKEKVEKLKQALGSGIGYIKVVDPAKLSQIDDKGKVVYGNPTAKTTVYVISDPECPFCAKFDAEMLKVLKNRNDVKFEVILFPLPMHKEAEPISQNIICQKDMKKKREILEESFEAIRKRDSQKLKELAKSCDKAKPVLEKNMQIVQELGIRGTPAIILPHGVVISGYIPAEKLNELLDAVK